MSIGSFFEHIFGGSSADTKTALNNATVGATAALKAFGNSEASKVITALAATDIGAAVKADVVAATNSTLTGPQKFDQVVTNTLPLVLKFVTGGGLAAVEADVLGITQGLVQTIYLDVASTGFGKIVAEFVKLLGI